MTQVLYLSYDGMTDPLGQSQVIPYLVGLSKRGYRFHLISFEKKKNYEEGKTHISNLLAESQIVWHPLTYTKSPPVLSTMYDLMRMKSKARELIRAHGINLIHCRSYISGIAGLELKSEFGLRFIFDMRGFYADERVDGGLWNLKNPVFNAVYRYFKNKEKEMLLGADAVISLTHNAARIIDSWKLNGDKPLPVTVIPCCADLDLFDRTHVNESDQNRFRGILNLSGKKPVISYLGAIGTWYMLDEMLMLFKEMLLSKPEAVFLFITHEMPQVIMEKAAAMGISRESIRVTKASRKEVPALLSLSDVAVFFIKPTFSKQASSPTKQGEIMGMGIPIICNSGVGDTDYVINNYGAGVAIDLRLPDAYQQMVQKLDEVIHTSPEKIRHGAESFYSLEQGVERYAGVYERLLK